MQQAVLNALATLGGEARPKSVYPLVTAHFSDELTAEDLSARYMHGKNKWERLIQYARRHLKDKQYLSMPVDGVWKLTPLGTARLGTGLPNSKDLADVQPMEESVLLPSSAQGFMLSARNRKMIEMYAVKKAITHFEGEGFKVEPHGKPFDLLCKKRGKTLYVEVKGMTGIANGIILTRNEVELSRKKSAEFVLFVVSEVLVDNDTEALSGGVVRIVHPWMPREELLKVIGYMYDLSKHDS